MLTFPIQAPPGIEGVHLVLYDGECGFCNRQVRFLLERDRLAVFTFASLQSEVGRVVVERQGGGSRELVSFLVLADYRSNQARLLDRSDAALFVAGQLG